MTEEKRILVEIDIDCGRQGVISSSYRITPLRLTAYKSYLQEHADKEVYLYEVLGKHSEIMVTGQDILDSISIGEDDATGFIAGNTDIMYTFEEQVEDQLTAEESQPN